MITSLKTSVDPVGDLTSRLRLDRSARARGAVVVEGPSDEDVYARVFGMDKRNIFPAAGRPNVLGVVRSLGDQPMPGVTCVADRDFDDAASEFADLGFVVFSDNADMDSMLFASEVLDRVVGTWGSRAKLKRVGGMACLRSRVAHCISPLSALRAANVVEHWGVKFSGIKLIDLIEQDHLELKTASLAAKLANAQVSRQQLEVSSTADPPICPMTGAPLMSGKDLATAVDTALRKLVGNLSHQQVKDGLALRSLRLGVGYCDLAGTRFAERFDAALGVARAQVAAASE